MAWRLHLTDRIVRRLDILSGKPSLLAAWTSSDRVYTMELHNAARLTDRQIDSPPTRAGERWLNFVAELHASNDVFLPVVRTPLATLYQVPDGSLRVIRVSETELYLVNGTTETRLDTGGARIRALALDAGMIAALDTAGSLHLYRQAIHTATVETDLHLTEEMQPHLALIEGGSAVFAADTEQIVRLDGDGRELKRLSAGYTIGALACSPDGSFLATGDLDSNMIRVYDGNSLMPTHQRFALDLMADAKKTQSISSALAANTAVGTLAITNKGVIAFAMSGMVCATNLTRMIAMPANRKVVVES
ncbi:MAG: hypothetical protein IAE80_03860 [Anaerolinea sp.]|nr:hypothetical protein [Anaerolinea sp.]